MKNREATAINMKKCREEVKKYLAHNYEKLIVPYRNAILKEKQDQKVETVNALIFLLDKVKSDRLKCIMYISAAVDIIEVENPVLKDPTFSYSMN